MGSGLPPEDHTGKIYGDWIVVRRAPPVIPSTPGVAVPWLCHCLVCESEEWIVPGQFKVDGRRKRCQACYDKQMEPQREARRLARVRGQEAERLRNERLDRMRRGEEISPRRWSAIRRCAAMRDIPFLLTPDYALALFKEQDGLCALSGLSIELPQSSKDPGTASLDRKDSALPYQEGNVQWVHKDINKIKLDLPEERFIELCALVWSFSARVDRTCT